MSSVVLVAHPCKGKAANGIQFVQVEGRNPDIDYDNNFPFIDLWELSQSFILPTAAGVVTLSSDNANDSAAGSGAREVTIFGLDESLALAEEALATNGLSGVVGSQQFLRVFGQQVTSAGGSGENEGLMTTTLGGDPMAVIESGLNRSFSGLFTVPANTVGEIVQFGGSIQQAFGSIGHKEAEIALRVRLPGGLFIPEKTIALSTDGTSAFKKIIEELTELPAGTDIVMSARSNDQNVRANGELFLELEDVS